MSTLVSALLSGEDNANGTALKELLASEIAGKVARIQFEEGGPVQAGQLLAVLVQLPPSFQRRAPQRRYLAELLDELAGLPVAVEFRHSSWATDRVFAELEQRLQRIAGQGRAVLDLLAQRPPDLFRARRFFNLHLDGAERVAVQYAKTHRLVRSRVLEANFRNVLTQIEAAFQRQHQRLLQHEAMDLDIQIEVLRKQLKHEGIA